MKERIKVLFPIFIFFTVLSFLVADNFFFWDTIKLVAAPAIFFYENNFNQLILSNQYDTGHIPALSLYLAVIWKVFFKNLAISHFAMLPFVFGIIWQGYILIQRYVANIRSRLIILLLALLGPTFLSQALMVSPEIPLLFFFLLGLNTLSTKRQLLFSLAVIGLVLMSSRGVILVVAIVFFEVICNVQWTNVKNIFFQLLKKSIKYLPGVILFLMYQIYHFTETGWVLSHENSPWAPSRVPNDFFGGIFNVGIFGWRMLDFGRVVICVPLLFLLMRYRKHIFSNKKLKHFFILLTVMTGLFLLLFMKYKYLTGHRYLLPLYFLVSIFTGYLVITFIDSKKTVRVIFVLFFVGLLTGNFWVYPNKIAQGWDSTLAHMPYYSLQKQMNSYLEKENIAIHNVGSEFPNLAKQQHIFLNENYKKFKKKEIGVDQYVLYSNINNDFTDDELDLLASGYTLKKEFKSFQVFVRLYEKVK